MRQPLENRKITVSRARYSVEYPASFMMVAAMNPCPADITTTPKGHVYVPAELFRNT